ncbi:uncharacterized protein LOC122309297 isoform X1 [Carya illinoinensis]|nr:uncharacterized protein LOC122309297 isoform X1 [Carya illinoinensis]
MHRYVKYLDRLPYPGQVEESCRIEQISLISREGRQYIQKLLPAKRFATNCYAVLSLIGYMFLVNATDPTIATSMTRIKFNAIIDSSKDCQTYTMHSKFQIHDGRTLRNSYVMPSHLSAGGVIGSILVVLCLFWVGLVEEEELSMKEMVRKLTTNTM